MITTCPSTGNIESGRRMIPSLQAAQRSPLMRDKWRLTPLQAELRFFYRGMNTVAEYYDNGAMTPIDDTHYTRSVSYNPKTNAPLAIGDRLEFELSQFLDAPPRGRSNYYGTTMLYVVGVGLVPWETRGVFGDPSTEREDSYPIPNQGWLGGGTTIHRAILENPKPFHADGW